MARSGRAAASAVWILCAVGSGLLLGAAPLEAKEGYLRYPDIHGEMLVFTAEGDLWTAGVQGGEARRLTSHPGSEAGAKFSPDGRWIAFGGDYDGNRDIYVIAASGGEPRRLTWHPSSDAPLGWTPDGLSVVFASSREHPFYNTEVYAIPLEGGQPEKLPVGYVDDFAIDPETGRYAFTRAGGGGTWKRYRGGTDADIWVGDPKSMDYRQLTDFAGQDAAPMWHGGRIWFLSDQGGTSNLWSMQSDGSDRKRATDFGDWDARWPAMSPAGEIVFMLGGDLHLFDTRTATERRIEITLPSERVLTRVRYPDAEKYLDGFALSPDGERLLVEARGELFSVPVEEGVTLPITRGSGARESKASFAPKGERAAWLTDASGEQALVTGDAWGRGEQKTVVAPMEGRWNYAPQWSPDGKWLAWSDQVHDLYIAPADGGSPKKVDHCKQWEIQEYAWSPDGRWLAYVVYNDISRGSIRIHDTKKGESRTVTDAYTDNRTPAWDPEGRYLYFLSDRVMAPYIGAVDFETVQMEPTRPYALLLQKDTENPLAETEGMPPSAEGKGGKKGGKKSGDKGGKTGGASGGNDGAKSGDAGKRGGQEDDEDDEDDEDGPPEPVEIDFDGIVDRYVELPVEPGRYFGLAATEGKLFYLSVPAEPLQTGWGGDEDPKGTLVVYDLEEKEAKPFLTGVAGFDLQPKSGKIAVHKGRGAIHVLDADSTPGDDLSESKVSLAGITIELDPREEWRQIYFETWRNMRDFFWDENMHGVDWAKVRDQYASLLPRLATRGDLQDLIAEMIGEAVNSHTYVWGGDPGKQVSSLSTGLLGAVVSRQGVAYRVDRIYRGAAPDRIRSPLQEPGSEVREGEYIVSVNHQPFPLDRPFEASFQDMAGKSVLLTVNGTPSKEGARTVVVKPMDPGKASDLLYTDWVRRNREYVAEKSGGTIGYVHIPDMGGRGLIEFDTWFYPQLDKQGMIVDGRWNGGGFVSQLIVSRLQRHLIWWDRSRYGGVWTYPSAVLNGPFVVLTNEFAGSDGDIFPAAIQTAGVAPVIGTRTWGGVVGIRGVARPTVDDGAVTQPEFAWFHPDKGWAIENHGVDPDIVVENLPQDVARGIDAQLDRGIEEVLRLHKERPPMRPADIPPPDYSREAFRTRELSESK